jgi:hypothetical protein
MSGNDYVQQLWQQQQAREDSHGKVTRVVGWVLGVAVVVSLAGFMFKDYLAPYLHF